MIEWTKKYWFIMIKNRKQFISLFRWYVDTVHQIIDEGFLRSRRLKFGGTKKYLYIFKCSCHVSMVQKYVFKQKVDESNKMLSIKQKNPAMFAISSCEQNKKQLSFLESIFSKNIFNIPGEIFLRAIKHFIKKNSNGAWRNIF